MESHAKVVAEIARGLGRELDDQTHGRASGRMALSVGVAAAPGVKGKTLVAMTLAALLARELFEDVLLVCAGPSRPGAPDLAEVLDRPSDALPAALERVDERVLRWSCGSARTAAATARRSASWWSASPPASRPWWQTSHRCPAADHKPRARRATCSSR